MQTGQQKGERECFRVKMNRQGLKLVGAALLLVAALTVPVSAEEDDWCEGQAGACASMCGTTVSWGQIGTQWDSCYLWILGSCVGAWVPTYGATFGSGVENFECQGEPIYSSYCQCRY